MKSSNLVTIVRYTPRSRFELGFFQTWYIMFRNIINSRVLIVQLFKRDFFSTYKKSFIGIAWILLSPIVGIASWVFLQSANILNPGSSEIPFPVYILIGSSLWGLFMGFYSSAAGTLGAGSGFILQVKYPHEALLVKQTAQQIANFLITFSLNLIIILFFGIMPDWKIIFFPVLILPMFFLGAGLGLLVSVISIVASDITNIINILLGFLFYLTPIIYTSDSISSPFLKLFSNLNPLSYILSGVRDIILTGKMHNPHIFFSIFIGSLIFFLLSWRLFFVSENKVIEKML